MGETQENAQEKWHEWPDTGYHMQLLEDRMQENSMPGQILIQGTHTMPEGKSR